MAQRRELRPLSDLFAEWPPGVPDSLEDLVNADYETLQECFAKAGTDDDIAHVIMALRSHGLEIRNAADREIALSSPEVVARVLGVNLRPPRDKWITYPLDKTRRRIARPHTGQVGQTKGGSRYACIRSSKVPSADALGDVPDGGTYLMVRNDTIDVISIPGVVERIDLLRKQVPLADVVIYDTSDHTPITYSLRRFAGAKGREAVDIKLEEDLERKVRSLWTP